MKLTALSHALKEDAFVQPTSQSLRGGINVTKSCILAMLNSREQNGTGIHLSCADTVWIWGTQHMKKVRSPTPPTDIWAVLQTG